MNIDEYGRMYAVEDTHWWYVGMREATLGLLNGHLDDSAPQRPRILDAGCGTGGLLIHLEKLGWAAGVDLSATALSFARRRELPHLARASVEALPFADATYDLVTCMDVLYHLQVQEDLAALAEFRRVLRPGGWLLVKVPAFEALRGQHDQTVHTRHRYTIRELCEKLAVSGFQVERATYANTLLMPLAAAKRGLEQVLPLAPEGSSDIAPPSGWLNHILTVVLQAEARLVQRVDLPVGVSAMALARRV